MTCDMENKISVIIPVYNTAEYLPDCLNSVMVQTYDNLEIIIVDDGSTDGSWKICEFYVRKDKRIKAYHKENGGLSDARNFGVDKSTGEFLSFIDSDDTIHKDFFKILMENQREVDADISGAALMPYYNLSEINLSSELENGVKYTFYGSEALKKYLNPGKTRIIQHGLCMKIYRRSLFENLRFEKGRLHEDLFITYKLLNECCVYIHDTRKLYFYYQNNAKSICSSYSIKNYMDEYDAAETIKEDLKGIDEVKEDLILFLLHQNIGTLKRGCGIVSCSRKTTTTRQLKKMIKDELRASSKLSVRQKIKMMVYISNIYLCYSRLAEKHK